MRINMIAGWIAAVFALASQSGLEPRIDAAVKGVQAQIPGLSIAVVVDGRLAYARGFGTIALDAARPATADTQYRLASITKSITAVAILKLVEQGRIELESPAKAYCPAVEPLNGSPTVRDFLLHQSGMRHTTDAEDETIVGAFPRLSEALAAVAGEPLVAEPGAQTIYSSWGYTVLGCVIENVAGTSYAEFVERHVLGPAGMTDTAFDRPDYAGPNFSPGFRPGPAGLQPSVVVDTRFKQPSSGLISTAPDLAKFAIALFDNRLLAEPQVQTMLSVRALPGDARAPLAAGWAPASSTFGARAFTNNGSMEGTSAIMAIVPERRVAVVILANRERYVPALVPLLRETLRAALGLPSQ